MSSFVECRVCGFVLRAVDDAEAVPMRWDACPDCGGTDFEFPAR